MDSTMETKRKNRWEREKEILTKLTPTIRISYDCMMEEVELALCRYCDSLLKDIGREDLHMSITDNYIRSESFRTEKIVSINDTMGVVKSVSCQIGELIQVVSVFIEMFCYQRELCETGLIEDIRDNPLFDGVNIDTALYTCFNE